MSSTYPEAYRRALDLFTESVIKPDHALRTNAAYGNCYQELMEVRQHCLAYLNTLKEIHQTLLQADAKLRLQQKKLLQNKCHV